MFKKTSVLFLLLLSATSRAEEQAATENVTNDQVIQNWQQSNPGGPVPELVQGDDGTTQVKWSGSITPEVYANRVISKNGSVNTALSEGTFHKTTFHTEVQRTKSSGTSDSFQIDVLESDDRGVLRDKKVQLSQLRLVHTEERYSLVLGDIAPQFSSLSSSLAARGILGQRKIDESYSVTGFLGTVSESWEALAGAVKRNQFLRDSYGVKLERSMSTTTNAYVTAQAAADRRGSITNEDVAASAKASSLDSYSAGLQYNKEQWQLSGEFASGRGKLGSDQQKGNAAIVDGRWSGERISTYGGYHAIDAGFTTLSAMAAPGVTEVYGGADWATASWLSLGGDLRNSKAFTLASDDAVSSTDTRTVRVLSNLMTDHWTLSAQNSQSVTSVPSSSQSTVEQSSVSLNYGQTKWSAGLTHNIGVFRYGAGSTTDSDTHDWQVSLGYRLSNNSEDSSLPFVWSWDATLSATLQDQDLKSGGDVENKLYGLSLSAQRQPWGRLGLMLSSGVMKQATAGASDLKTNSLQLEASRDFANYGSAKIYVRDTQRNIHDPVLESTERVVGAQYSYSF